MASPLESPIARLHSALRDEMGQVNNIILERLKSDVPLISQVAEHLIKAGGKRLRPLLTLACSRLFCEKPKASIALASAVEMIHTATLLHDDVVDSSSLRRGQQTANDIWGNTASVLVGDFLFSKAFQLMVECQHLGVLNTLSTAAAKIAEGEVLQLSVSHDLNLPVETYFQIISSKTAALFAAACEVGGVIVGMEPELVYDLYQFGQNLGMAFQIMDDILDYTACQSDMGKARGDDFSEGKVTLPVILSIQKNIEPDFWQRCFIEQAQQQQDLSKAIDLFTEHNIIKSCLEHASIYANQARYHLEKMPKNMIRSDLESLIDYSLNRRS